MQLPTAPASASTAHQLAKRDLKRCFASTTTMTIINSAATPRNSQRAYSVLLKNPNAAPLLWMLTSFTTPGMSAASPVESVIFTVTQYLSHWSPIKIMAAIIAYSIYLSPLYVRVCPCKPRVYTSILHQNAKIVNRDGCCRPYFNIYFTVSQRLPHSGGTVRSRDRPL